MLLAKIKIIGHSMTPSFKHNSIVLASSIPYFFSRPKVGDVIVLQKKKKMVKRICRMRHAKYFVIGDNKEESTDSRDFGWIEKKDILGKVIYQL